VGDALTAVARATSCYPNAPEREPGSRRARVTPRAAWVCR
jgi:hypothetical protein